MREVSPVLLRSLLLRQAGEALAEIPFLFLCQGVEELLGLLLADLPLRAARGGLPLRILVARTRLRVLLLFLRTGLVLRRVLSALLLRTLLTLILGLRLVLLLGRLLLLLLLVQGPQGELEIAAGGLVLGALVENPAIRVDGVRVLLLLEVRVAEVVAHRGRQRLPRLRQGARVLRRGRVVLPFPVQRVADVVAQGRQLGSRGARLLVLRERLAEVLARVQPVPLAVAPCCAGRRLPVLPRDRLALRPPGGRGRGSRRRAALIPGPSLPRARVRGSRVVGGRLVLRAREARTAPFGDESGPRAPKRCRRRRAAPRGRGDASGHLLARDRATRATPDPKRLQRQQRERGGERDLVAVLEARREPRGDLTLLHPSYGVCDAAPLVPCRTGVEELPVSLHGDLLEGGGVETRRHDPSLLVLLVAGQSARLVAQRNRPSGLGAATDRRVVDALLAGGGGRRRAVALEVLAVGEEDDRLVPALGGVEQPRRLFDRASDVAPRARDEVRLRRVEEQAQGSVVQRERARRGRPPPEDDQTHAIPGQRADERRGLRARLLEAARRNVLGEHRRRQVQGEDDVDPAPADRLVTPAPLRAREGDDHERDRAEPQRGQRRLAAPRPAHDQPRQDRLRGEPAQASPTRRAGEPADEAQHGHEQQQVEHGGRGEVHRQGTFARIVREERKPAPIRTRAGARNHPNSSS